jgi:hypothetical protein
MIDKDTAFEPLRTQDGGAILGGRPGVGYAYDNLTSSGRPLSPESARTSTVTARNPAPVSVPDGVNLPFLSVARVYVGREIQRVKAEVEDMERQLAAGVFGANGQPVQHLMDARAAIAAAKTKAVEIIADLENLSDEEVRLFAYSRGAR